MKKSIIISLSLVLLAMFALFILSLSLHYSNPVDDEIGLLYGGIVLFTLMLIGTVVMLIVMIVKARNEGN